MIKRLTRCLSKIYSINKADRRAALSNGSIPLNSLATVVKSLIEVRSVMLLDSTITVLLAVVVVL